MNASPARQLDVFDNPAKAAKAACREGNLRVLREAAFLLWEDGERRGGTTMCHTIDTQTKARGTLSAK